MARLRTTFELTLPERDADIPAYQWLYAAVRAEILEGRLKPGAHLPSSRDLAEQYGLSRGTVVSAFQQLESEGYIAGTVGSGTYVSKVLPEELLHVPRDPRRQPSRTKPRRRLSDYAGRVSFFPPYAPHPGRAFRANVPALALFPTTLWARIASHRMRRLTTSLLLGSGAMGYLPLREAIAEYLGTSRGVRCVPEQIAIVSGMQEALDLTARIFVNRGDRVCMEDPGYIGATVAFEAAGAKIIGLPVDREGVLLRRSSMRGARLVYVTPAHQFPLGVTMSLSRRLELLEWARKSGAMILEDDYDSEYRYSGRPVPALQGLDQNDCVLFAGSFSKVLFPSLRLGYLVVPRDLVPTFDAVKSASNRHASLLDQAVLCDFITEGHFGRHLRRMRQEYAERLAVLIESAQQHLAGFLDVSPIEAGLQTVGWLPTGVDGKRVAKAAAARKVHITPLSEYSRRPMARDGLQLGFAAIDPHEIRRGIRELEIALSEVA